MHKHLLSLLLLQGCLLSANVLSAQSIVPYLQAIKDSAIVLNWKTSTPVVSPFVRYGISQGSLDDIVTGTSQAMNDVGYINNYFYHTIKLHGLVPATKYFYRVVSGNDSSDIYSFHTLPEAGMAPNAQGRLRFLILGDNQIKAQPRFDSLMVAAKRKMMAYYGSSFNDSVSFILNLGDQVDVGTLDHYEHVHFSKSKYLSPWLPIQTAVGNHETYGTLQMQAYYDHFVLDSMHYKGIYSGTEDYYAFQAGNVVIVYTNTENTGGFQFNWVKKVIDTATADPTVKWIITIGHRPYQAEQYVGDISHWIRNTVVPYCMLSPKFFMHVGAHHHLYARGQMKDVPAYNIISGGTAWNQYWGMASEENFDDVQKTISQWAYQLVDVDMINDRIGVTTFSVGSIYGWRDNMVIDSFYRDLNLAIPIQPAITNVFPDSLELPLILTGTSFQTTSGELLNSTEFQLSLDRQFNTIEKISYRHYEDLFGAVPGANPDTTLDQHLGVDIESYTVPANTIPNGWHYVRLRHRDRNQQWSPWSVTDSFKVFNSIIVDPLVVTDTNRYEIGDTIHVSFTNGSPDPAAWIGIYRKGQTPGASSPSQAWDYTGGANGTLKFTLSSANEYFVAYFEDGGYTEIADRVAFYYGPTPVLTTTASNYNVGQPVQINFSNGPALTNDWVGIYKVGMTPGGPASVTWTYVYSSNGTYTATGLGKGYYFAAYLLRDQYFEAGERVYFSVGDTITTLVINQTNYNLGEYISASWVDGPGIPKDWLGIYPAASNPNVDTFVSYTYIDGLPSGARDIPDTSMPKLAGNYFIVLFTNDSYDEVSNRVYFQMSSTPLSMRLHHFSGRAEGMSHLLFWEAAEEQSLRTYTLQHSTNGTDFRDIYHAAPVPALNRRYDYLFDEPTNGNNYYRLKLTETNGSESWSSVVLIHQNDRGENTISVYPNPVRAGNKSIIESPYPISQIDVLDSRGQMIYQTKNVQDKRFTLLHQDLPAGTYFIRIHSRKLYTAKLVITE